MADPFRILTSMCLGAALLGAGCTDDPMDEGGVEGALTVDTLSAGSMGTTGDGDGDGDTAGDGDGDGDGASTDPPVCDPPSPYMGGWDIGCCQQEVAPQNGWSPGGVQAGTIMPDWTFDVDQFGEPVRLYDFCHDAIWFEYVALW